MKAYLEHANVTVRDLDAVVAFLQTALPHYRVRGRGESDRRWLHLGDDTTYVALEEASQNAGGREPYADPGVNHLGFVVDDVAAVRERLLAAGFREGIRTDPHQHRKRIYFHDADDNEYEFVEYLSAEPAERNSYDD